MDRIRRLLSSKINNDLFYVQIVREYATGVRAKARIVRAFFGIILYCTYDFYCQLVHNKVCAYLPTNSSNNSNVKNNKVISPATSKYSRTSHSQKF